MVELGGLYDKNDVKLLILYLLKNVQRPVSLTILTDIIMRDGLVNYFQFTEAHNDLLVSGHIDLIVEDDAHLFKPTPLGLEAIKLFEKRLPHHIREKTMRSALEVLAALRRDSEIKCSVTESENGFIVNCKIIDSAETLLGVDLFVPNMMQAETVLANFKDNAEEIYRGVVSLMIGSPSSKQ